MPPGVRESNRKLTCVRSVPASLISSNAALAAYAFCIPRREYQFCLRVFLRKERGMDGWMRERGKANTVHADHSFSALLFFVNVYPADFHSQYAHLSFAMNINRDLNCFSSVNAKALFYQSHNFVNLYQLVRKYYNQIKRQKLLDDGL